MANLRKIRTRIKSVQSTQQITKSMKMVAASKLRRTQAAFGDLRAFADKSGEILARVSAGAEDNPYLTTHAENRRVCYVLIVGNRGLCGTYNTALLRYLEELAAKEERESFLVVAGRWGKDMIQTLGLPVRRSFEISDAPTSAEARELSGYLRELYRDDEADEIVLVYQQFHSVLSQNPDSRTLLKRLSPAVFGFSESIILPEFIRQKKMPLPGVQRKNRIWISGKRKEKPEPVSVPAFFLILPSARQRLFQSLFSASQISSSSVWYR